MNLNATCIIQILNLGVTYCILHKLFLKPFSDRINAKFDAQNAVLANLKKNNHVIAQLQENKKKHLELFKEYLKNHYVIPPLVLQKIPTTALPLTHEDDLDTLVEQQKKLFIERAHACIQK
jgi:hypothetical protein